MYTGYGFFPVINGLCYTHRRATLWQVVWLVVF